MSCQRFIFVGNRRFVLEEMVQAELDLTAIAVVEGSHLHRDVMSGNFVGTASTHVIGSKGELLDLIRRENFDVLVSNGCPYILPIAQLPEAIYANIHPSCLPDLRGIDPVIGAVLFQRDSGATCHLMDTGVDTGPIISQVRIPYSDDIDVTLLYQMSFYAERRAFREALDLDFRAGIPQVPQASDIYYSRKPDDRVIDFSRSIRRILQQIKAFSNRSQGCEFLVDEQRYRVYGARVLTNSFLVEMLKDLDDGLVGISIENAIVFKKDGVVIQFRDVADAQGLAPKVGSRLF